MGGVSLVTFFTFQTHTFAVKVPRFLRHPYDVGASAYLSAGKTCVCNFTAAVVPVSASEKFED